jgi:hypothetical protein
MMVSILNLMNNLKFSHCDLIFPLYSYDFCPKNLHHFLFMLLHGTLVEGNMLESFSIM